MQTIEIVLAAFTVLFLATGVVGLCAFLYYLIFPSGIAQKGA